MKKENIIVIASLIVLIIGLTIIHIKTYYDYKINTIISTCPFNKLSILAENIDIQSNKRNYSINTDCSLLKDKNNQIVSYKLKDQYNNYKISISSHIFNKDLLLKDNYEEVTSIEIKISVTDPDDKYEQIYFINATCNN